MTSPSTPPVRLPVADHHDPKPHVCPGNQYLWEEEIALVRAMHDVKLEAREARKLGDVHAVDRLRVRFKELDARREKLRRERLDSLGLFDYD